MGVHQRGLRAPLSIPAWGAVPQLKALVIETWSSTGLNHPTQGLEPQVPTPDVIRGFEEVVSALQQVGQLTRPPSCA